MTEKPIYTSLPARGLLRLEGPDRISFLQNIITNDMDFLKPGAAIYSCLLTPQGKFLHDFFVSEDGETILLECEGGARAHDLNKRLSMYRLRADVKISVKENIAVYSIFGSSQGYADPRHPDMGTRSLDKPDGEEKPFEFWDAHRIKLCIPDGSRDMTPEYSTMDEAHIEKLNGVSYEKGCYVGQELTARMHYRGIGKKHLYTIQGENLPAHGEEIKINDKTIGEMRSSCGNSGLALIKDESLDLARTRFVVLS
jgi:folate-binding protein YgfZ